MYRYALSRREKPPKRNERGAVAIIMALSMSGILVVCAMVLDFGLIRVDRQIDKSAIDAAAMAGVHSIDVAGANNGQSYPYVGICAAIRYLRANYSPRFANVTSASGAWHDGTGAALAANGCTSTTLQTQACVTGNSSTWGQFDWAGTYEGTRLEVHIQSGYKLPTSGTDGWSEDTLPAARTFADDGAQGCNQLEVEVHQFRDPTLGSIATKSQLIASVRSVGRVYATSGGNAPALLLLKRHGCPVLSTGSNSGGYIAVKGAVSSNGLSQPGTIHADTDGVPCSGGSGANIYWGRFANGIVSYAAPVPNCPTPTTCVATATADSTKPGTITSYAAFKGTTGSVLRDSNTNVCGSSTLFGGAACSGTKTDVSPGSLVTRHAVDTRYLAGITAVRDAANGWWGLNQATASSLGYGVVTNCTAGTSSLPNKPVVFVDCPSGFKGPNTGGATFGSSVQTVVFSGPVNPSSSISIPNGTHVYIKGQSGGDAINIGSGASFSVHSAGNTTSGVCNSTPTGPDPGTLTTNKAVVVVRNGDIKENSGTLQMCYTTLLMMGSDANACFNDIVNQEANGPNISTPCSGSIGDGQLSLGGTPNIDWTAPNQYNIMTLSDGTPDPAKKAAWSDPNGPEDLAFWDESGSSSSKTYNMNGSANVHVEGVYMAPNAEPFTLGGSATFNLTNAQFIASSFALGSSNTNLIMGVDPNSAVQLPTLRPIGLVR